MKDELITFQKRALEKLRSHCAAAHNEYQQSRQSQVVSFTAPTGAGKTIIMASLIEDILFGTEHFVEQPEAIFVWLSDSPELNLQSKEKIDSRSDRIRMDQCVVISDDSFDRETLEEGHIYFLNTQKLSRTSNLTHYSDSRQYTIWDTLANTVNDKSDRLYVIIDEAHRGMRGQEAGRATSTMQKFILGSEKDGLPPMPVVIGMSATIERFNQLVKNSTAISRPVRVSPEEVRSSGLLKDRVIIYYPKDASEQKDMAVLQAATDEWLQKCIHWETFCREQHHSSVKPVFVVQVLNGTGGRLSDTELDSCLAKIEERSGRRFAKGEVVHAFGDTKGAVVMGGLEVPYMEPSKIQGDKQVRVVFFKETLSTGWDCPRAETMMSFRRYVDATAIAQLLGRMVRTPIHQRIMVDDMLNDVQLFLPHFDEKQVKKVVDELQNEEGGELPTEIIGDEIEHGSYVMLTARRTTRKPKPVNDGPTLFDKLYDEPLHASDAPIETAATPHPATDIPVRPERKPKAPTASPEPIAFEYDGIDRPAIVGFINGLALPSYLVRPFQQSDYLKSLFALSRFLLMSGLDVNAKATVVDAIVERIHGYIQGMKRAGKYGAAKEKVTNFEMLATVYDAFGQQIKATPVRNLFSETNVDIERQLRIAERQLAGEGVAVAYGRKHDDPDHPINFMVDVILFVCDEEQMKQLHAYAKTAYHKLNDQYRQKTTRLADSLKTQYRNIVRDSAEISEVPFYLGENIMFLGGKEGDEYDDHLFVNEQTGTARIKLNSWERKVIEDERLRDGFRCWYRNPSRGSDALALYHHYKGAARQFYPDFLIVRRENGGDYILDILEPHDPTRDDNVSKAKSLAQYATENPSIGRAQLIRLVKTPTGESLSRLDFAAHSELREKVAVINTPDELDNLFLQYGHS